MPRREVKIDEKLMDGWTLVEKNGGTFWIPIAVFQSQMLAQQFINRETILAAEMYVYRAVLVPTGESLI